MLTPRPMRRTWSKASTCGRAAAGTAVTAKSRIPQTAKIAPRLARTRLFMPASILRLIPCRQGEPFRGARPIGGAGIIQRIGNPRLPFPGRPCYRIGGTFADGAQAFSGPVRGVAMKRRQFIALAGAASAGAVLAPAGHAAAAGPASQKAAQAPASARPLLAKD